MPGEGRPLGNGQVVNEINVVSYQKSQADPRVKSVFRARSACMRERGHSYAAPRDTSYQRQMTASKSRELGRAENAIRTQTASADRVLSGDR